MEREAEEPALPAAADERRDVQERRRKNVAAVEDDDLPPLQGQEDARVSGMRDRGRLREPGRERLESDLGRALSADAPCPNERQEPDDEENSVQGRLR